MLRAINLDGKEFIIVKRNLGIFGDTDIISIVKTVKDIRNGTTPKQRPFDITFIFDDAEYKCSFNNNLVCENFEGNVETIINFFKKNIIVFEDTSKFNLKELAFSDKNLLVDLFDNNHIPVQAKDTFFNFIQELSAFLGDTLTDYQKNLVPVKQGSTWYIGCMDLYNYSTTPLNQEPERIKRAIKFICNTLKINNETEAVFIEKLGEKEFKLDCYALSLSFDDPHIQYIYTSYDVISLKDTTKYFLKSGGK